MSTYTYTKLASFVAFQLFGYGIANQLKESIDYLEDDVFGNPSGISDGVKEVTQASGKKIYMSDGTSDQAYLSGTDFTITGDVHNVGTTMLGGQRHWLMYTSQGSVYSVDQYLKGSTGGGGFGMALAGSITALSCAMISPVVSTTGNSRIQLNKNGVTLISGANIAISTAATRYQSYATYTRGTYIFAQGDDLAFYLDRITGNYGVYVTALMEVVYDI